MSIAEHIKASFQAPDFIISAYLGDLSDDDLFIRPAEGINHINWQIGHIITSEHRLVEQLCPGSMPPLPEHFNEVYNGDNADSDDRSKFWSKADLLKIMQEQRAGTLAALEKLSDEELMKPSPEELQQLGTTIGSIFAMQGTHWTMHAGQWVIVRRQLGKKAMF